MQTLRSKSPFFYLFLVIFCIFIPLQLQAADEEEGEKAVEDDAKYFELSPPFVVNLQDTGKRIRFLQARIQILAYGNAKIEIVKTHDAAVRDALITLLSAQTREDISTAKKKKALQEKALKTVQKVLKEETGRQQIEGLYFTSFVVQ